MKTTKSTLHVLGAVLLLSVCSCANLEHVNTFATTSVKALSSASAIGYSYTQSYEDFHCKAQKHIGLYELDTKENLSRAFTDSITCNTTATEKADKALTTINGVVSAYLTGLANLSADKAVNYNYSNLVSAINADTSKLSFSGTEVTAIGNIATIVSNDLMNAYRRNKLKTIVKKAEPDIQIVLSAYIKQMNYFKTGVLEDDKTKLGNWYSTYLTKHISTLSPYEKSLIFQSYLDQKAKIESYQTLTNSFVKSLEKIKSGHTELSKDADHLTEDNIKQLINGYSADIFSLISQFNQLKTANQ
jgi:hypothetical protein